MLAYKFLSLQYGLKSLYERRLRRTRINELNDPFELRPYDLSNPDDRLAFLRYRDEMSQRFGMMCFSADWCNPVIWAHYSDKHRGLCLGFNIHEGEARTQKVEYITAPLPFPQDFLSLDLEQKLRISGQVLCTKYRHWEYEKEIRTWTDLEEEFFDFCDMLQLAEVIVGAECKLPVGEVTRALGSLADRVVVKKARAAHDSFRIVQDGAEF